MKSAVQTIQEELYKIQNQMLDCCTEEGIVKSRCREEYLDLMKKETKLKESLEYLKTYPTRKQK